MPDATVQTEISSTRGMPAEESREFWRTITATYQGAMSCEFLGGAPLSATVARVSTTAHQLLTWRSPPIRYRRTTRHIRLDDVDSYLLVLPIAGTITVDHQDRELQLTPDSASLMTMTRPFDVAHTPDTQLAVLTVARHDIYRHLRGRADLTTPIDLSTGLGNVLRAMLTTAFEQREHLAVAQFDALFDRMVDLLCVLMSGTADTAVGQLSEVEAAVKRYVRQHAEDTNLNGESIAKALGWSVRQIQLALQHSGTTPRELIREERLALARSRLTSAAYQRTSITELAHLSGFGSAGTFSTAFRHRFGVTPRELRRKHSETRP